MERQGEEKITKETRHTESLRFEQIEEVSQEVVTQYGEENITEETNPMEGKVDSIEEDSSGFGTQYGVDNITEEAEPVTDSSKEKRELPHERHTSPCVPLKRNPSSHEMPQESKPHKKPKAMRILVMGKTGTGKSSLINSFMGRDVAKVKDGATPQDHKPIEVYEGHVEEVKVTMVDTRGLGDPKVENEEILDAINKFLRASSAEFDLVLICIRLDCRVDRSTVDMMKKIGKICGNDMFWKRAVVVLTFANMFETALKLRHEGLKRNEIEKKIAHEVEEISNTLQSSMPKVVFKEIPFFCAGWSHQKEKLSTSDDWLHSLFIVCLQRCSKNSKSVIISLMAKVLTVTVLTAGGAGIGGLTGAACGGVVGAVAGTVFFPVFGTAAGTALGAGIGSMIGSAVVGGVMLVSTSIYALVKKN